MSLHMRINIIFLFLSICFTTNAKKSSFNQNYVVNWGGDHVSVLDHGNEVQMKIDQSSGGGIKSKQSYSAGIFSMNIKVPQNANGIATTFYLTSLADNAPGGPHAELDFELLGHNGPPYTLNTNVFAQDNGGREQQFNLWFDPTSNFHEYKFVWNPQQIWFLIDDVPIRIYKNYGKSGAKYPALSMHAYATLWNDPKWLGSTNWTLGPFFANYGEFAIDGCSDSIRKCKASKYTWNPSREQWKRYNDIRKNRMTYDYCKGTNRNNFPECRM